MNDNIDKNEIRRAIDRLQAEHPCGISYDPAAFVNMETVNTIKECVDKIARRMMEDTEINIICEFAKLYLEGARPMVMPKQEWIPCSERLPEECENALAWIERDAWIDGSDYPKRKQEMAIGWHIEGRWCFDGYAGSTTECLAWMPLPEPYKAGDPDA